MAFLSEQSVIGANWTLNDLFGVSFVECCVASVQCPCTRMCVSCVVMNDVMHVQVTIRVMDTSRNTLY